MNPTIIIETNRLTLDDFLQLQSLLKYEQEERDRHIQACHYHHPQQSSTHGRRAINPHAADQSRLERERLEKALMRLKFLKDQYRRQRAAKIQAYLEAYREQALIKAVQQEEERYYRQCIAAALEQRRVNHLWQTFLDEKKQEALLNRFEKQSLSSDNNRDQHVSEQQEEVQEETNDYSQYRSEQLADLLKQVFSQEHEEPQQQQQDTRKQENEDDAMAEVWKYVSDQKADSETPRTAFLSSEQDEALGNPDVDDNSNAKPEENSTETEEQNNNHDADSLSDGGSPSTAPSPPLQDHVITLKDLIQQLASEPVMVGEQVTNFRNGPKPLDNWAKQPQEEGRSPDRSTLNNQKSGAIKEDQQTEKRTYLPQHIFTEAEPTPTLENMPNTPIGAASEDTQEKDVAHFVDSVAEEQKNEAVPPNQQKREMQQELDHISSQLDPGSDLVQRLEKVLQSTLHFSKQSEGTLLLNANTDANRQFLGSEDELMRVIFKLDAIDSCGDDEIRQYRRSLVKKCESMLDQLDHLKQTQWEKALSSTNHRHRKKRNHHKKKKGRK